MERRTAKTVALLALAILLGGLIGMPASTLAQDAPGDQDSRLPGIFLPLISGSSQAAVQAAAASPLAVTVTASPSPVASGH